MDDSNEKYLLLDRVAALRPATALDVGCGCGDMTVRLAPLCGQVTAIDLFDRLIERCRNERSRPNVVYLPMDARAVAFADRSFPVVLERDSLHHMSDWRKAVAEMARVAQSVVLIEEPIDDPRSDAKRASEIVQDLMLDIQHEVGHPHFKHIPLGDLLASLPESNFDITHTIYRSDEPKAWEGEEEAFRFFAVKTTREQYWLDRFANLKQELGGRQLCESDKVLIEATRRD